jgi:outer membrane scaffolding protein for murein synthesis (MipA/OmpV family)
MNNLAYVRTINKRLGVVMHNWNLSYSGGGYRRMDIQGQPRKNVSAVPSQQMR